MRFPLSAMILNSSKEGFIVRLHEKRPWGFRPHGLLKQTQKKPQGLWERPRGFDFYLHWRNHPGKLISPQKMSHHQLSNKFYAVRLFTGFMIPFLMGGKQFVKKKMWFFSQLVGRKWSRIRGFDDSMLYNLLHGMGVICFFPLTQPSPFYNLLCQKRALIIHSKASPCQCTFPDSSTCVPHPSKRPFSF